MTRVVVVGSGPSGVHFALTLLRQGHEVQMLDVGRVAPEIPAAGADFEALKRALPDPTEYLLGAEFEAVTLPGPGAGVYAFPPSKRYTFDGAPGFPVDGQGFEPLSSLAQGGLAQAWTAGVYPFNDDELEDFAVSYAELAPYYAEVARRIGINGSHDDLARFMPVHEHLMEPLHLDPHSEALLRTYGARRERLHGELGCYMGRSRIATLTRSSEGREGCTYCGRCLWGCPSGSLYTPAITLRECRRYPRFRYQGGVRVTHFQVDECGRVVAVHGRTEAGDSVHVPVDVLALAAGTLSTSRIFLESLQQIDGARPRLTGLMDNRQILQPYLFWRLIGAPYAPARYQYHQLALGLTEPDPKAYIHAQITSLTTGLIHPIVQRLPLDLRTATAVFRHVRAALGIANVNLHDNRRAENYVQLSAGPSASASALEIHYVPDAEEPERIRRALARTSRALRKLGCIVPTGMAEIRPMGAGVHYAGTLPMSRARRPLTTAPSCQSHDFENLYIVDGASFPFLPAKNITFTLMANAVRVAEHVGRTICGSRATCVGSATRAAGMGEPLSTPVRPA